MDQLNNDQVPNPPVLPPIQPQLPPPPPVINPVVPPAGQVPIVQAQWQQNPNGNIDLKLQQTKLPEFWGAERKGLHLGSRIRQEGRQNGLRQQLVRQGGFR